MAVLQSTFNDDAPKGYPGMEADGELSNIITRTLEGATACAFGRAVYQGTAARGATLTPSANLLGFAVARKGLAVTSTRAADTFIAGDNVPIKNRGKIWVASAAAAAARGKVYVTPAGAITSASSGNTEAVGWEFDDTIAAAGCVRIARR